MTTEKFTFNEAEATSYFDKRSIEAEKLLRDPDKLEHILQKLEQKLKKIPVAGSSLAYIPLMISLVRSYIKKEYPDVPLYTIISIIVVLVYVLSPIDLIPDIIPGFGYLDDASIVLICLKMVKGDLDDYKSWQKQHGKIFDDIPDYNGIDINDDKLEFIAKAFMKSRGKYHK